MSWPYWLRRDGAFQRGGSLRPKARGNWWDPPGRATAPKSTRHAKSHSRAGGSMIDGHLQGGARGISKGSSAAASGLWDAHGIGSQNNADRHARAPAAHQAKAASVITEARAASDWVQASLPQGCADVIRACYRHACMAISYQEQEASDRASDGPRRQASKQARTHTVSGRRTTSSSTTSTTSSITSRHMDRPCQAPPPPPQPARCTVLYIVRASMLGASARTLGKSAQRDPACRHGEP